MSVRRSHRASPGLGGDGGGRKWVIADWGLVTRRYATGSVPLTRAGTPLGTEGFAAPEVMNEGHNATPAADVYSLGRVAAWYLTGQADYVRRHVLAATTVFDLMREQDLTLAGLTQPDLDRWAAQNRFTYPQPIAHFIRWTVASKHATGLNPPNPEPDNLNGPRDTERRWADARRLLHDATLKLSDRIAGLLVLLYAQPAVDIAGLTVADVHDDGTQVTLMLGTEPIILPEPLAQLMRELLATRHGHATIGRPETVPWLLPGGRPGHPLGGDGLGDRLRNIGLRPRQDRATALFALATELPAAVLARMLGISIHTAVDWQQATSGDWMTYAAEVSRRTPCQPRMPTSRDRPSRPQRRQHPSAGSPEPPAGVCSPC